MSHKLLLIRMILFNLNSEINYKPLIYSRYLFNLNSEKT